MSRTDNSVSVDRKIIFNQAIAKYKKKSSHTVRTSLHRWTNQGMRGLWEKTGKSLNKNQAMRKFGKLIIGKTTGYTARWLYQLLMRNCIKDEQ